MTMGNVGKLTILKRIYYFQKQKKNMQQTESSLLIKPYFKTRQSFVGISRIVILQSQTEYNVNYDDHNRIFYFCLAYLCVLQALKKCTSLLYCSTKIFCRWKLKKTCKNMHKYAVLRHLQHILPSQQTRIFMLTVSLVM